MKQILFILSIAAFVCSCETAYIEDEDAWKYKTYQTIFLSPEPENYAYTIGPAGGDLTILAYYDDSYPAPLNETCEFKQGSFPEGHITFTRTRIDERKVLYLFHIAENTYGKELRAGVELSDPLTYKEYGFSYARFLIVQKAQ